MANPQTENGYIKIANELFEALVRIRIPGEARQVLDAIIRKTYGYNKKEDKISLSQLCLATGLKKITVCKAINKLLKMNLITKKGNGYDNIYSINKNFDTWKPLPKKVIVTHMGNKSLPKRVHTKDNSTKDTIGEQARPIVKILEIFRAINPTLAYGNKTERSAAQDLINQFGLEETLKMAKYAIAIQNEAYAPIITTPYQLKVKYAQLELYERKHA